MRNNLIVENIIRKYVREILNEEDFNEILSNINRYIFTSIANGEKIEFNVMPKAPYHKALKEFMQYGKFLRFPEKYILDWKDLALENIAKLSSLTEILGHSQWFPFDEFYDTFDYSEEGYENESDKPTFSEWIEKKNKEENTDEYKVNDWDTRYNIFRRHF